MKKAGILIVTTALLSLMSGSVMARRGYHHGGHGHHRSFTSVGFMFDMTPRYPAYYASPAVIAVEPVQQNYIQRNAGEMPATQYWYYCTDPQGYYPYVKECRGKWQKVVPFQPDAN